MKRVDTPIEGLCLIEPTLYGDARGFFMETYNQRDFFAVGIDTLFVQDNHSRSSKGVLRGLHFQRCNPQAKLVRVIRGAVLDVAVDLRPDSATYGDYWAVELSAENKLQLFIPAGFAHGFLTLSDVTEFVYKCSTIYDAQSDSGIRWNDPVIHIDWQLEKYGLDETTILLSEKDRRLQFLSEVNPNELFTT